MTKKALILDLDDTLIDTACLAALRDDRAWRECVNRVGETICFEGFGDALGHLRGQGVAIGIVTASVSFYASAVLSNHNIAYDALVAYHDCSPRKPHPAPINLCLRKLGCSAEEAVALGDADSDAKAYRAAGVVALGAGWSPSIHSEADWTAVLDDPMDLLAYF